MDFKINKDVLMAGLQKTLGVTGDKSAIPIMANVLIQAQGGQLQLTATSRDMSLVSTYNAQITEEGATTVSAKKLHEMIKECQSEDIRICQNGGSTVKVTSEKAVYKIPFLPADNFPDVHVGPDVKYFTIAGAALKDLINRVSHAVSPDEVRAAINGALLETESVGQEHLLRMVATDGHRLVKSEVVLPEACKEITTKIIIPRRGLAEIKKQIEGHEQVGIGLQNNDLVIKAGNNILKVSLVDAKFPDYTRVIPLSADALVIMVKDDILHALKRIKVITSGDYNRVNINITSGKMTLFSSLADVGEATEELDVNYAGDDMEFSYNVHYLIDAISSISTDNILLGLNRILKPALIRTEENDHHLCIVMPLK